MRRGQSGVNALLGIDKPLGLTSHDVVGRVRRVIGERRVGHAGTLDPAASGVLIVGVGQATRLMGLLTLDEKSYVARIRFGEETDTCDAEGRVVRSAPVAPELFDEAFARSSLAAIIGEQDQVPPSYSAISIDGKRAYELARAGQAVEMPARRIRIIAAELIAIDASQGLEWTCSFTVSKGTYIRALARDLGASLGSCAHLSGLVRTSSGSVGLGSCISLEALEELARDGDVLRAALDPVAALAYPVRELSAADAAAVHAGRRIDASGAPDGQRVSLVFEGRLAGVWEARAGRLASLATFPSGIEGVRL